jgi:hypothetical protein
MKFDIIFAVLLVGTASIPIQAEVQPVAKLTLSSPEPYLNFGWSISLDGPTALVSANHASFAGKVIVYENSGQGNWSNLATLIPSDRQRGDSFGWSTSLDGSTALVGAARFVDGAAYVFERSQNGAWNQVAKLTQSDALRKSQFGRSVAIDDSLALVGANGSAHAFKKDASGSWTQGVALQPEGAVNTSNFGTSVALSGTTAIVGSMHDNVIGAAYVFREVGDGSWNQIARLIPEGTTGQTDFGWRTSFEGNTAIISAPWVNDRAGAAFVFRENEFGNWTQIAQLVPDDTHAGQRFGWSVSLSGSTALIGELDNIGQDTAYLFQEDNSGNWTQIGKLTGDRSLTFGYAAALDDNYAFVSDTDEDLGAVYVFQIPEPNTILLAIFAIVSIVAVPRYNR